METWYYPQPNLTGGGGHHPFLFTLFGGIMSLERFINDLRCRPVQSWAEKTAIVTIVVEILKEIGWSIFDIAHEVEVGSKRNKGRVDIKLSADNKSVLMECKAPRVNLDEDALGQLLGYAFQDGAQLAVLTNGVRWDFYLPFAGGQAARRKFADIDLLSKEEPDDLIAELHRFLGREAIASGEAEAAAKERMEAIRRGEQIKDALPAAWNELTVNPPEELVNLVANEVQRRIGHSPNDSQIRAFLSQSANAAMPERGAVQQRPSRPPVKPHLPSTAGKLSARPLRGYTLWGRHTEVTKWKQLFVKVCAQVYERHNKEFFRLEVGMRTPGRKWFAKDPLEINNPKVAPRQIPGSPYFVDVHGSAQMLENRCRRLLAFFGHSENDLRFD